MTRVRQLPRLFLRGSLMNVTQKGISTTDLENTQQELSRLIQHQTLQGHKIEFTKQLKVTIGGDYASDDTTAEQEFAIAVWRGLVYLKFHADYSFKCEACQSGHYTNQTGRKTPITRILDICPNCNCVEIIEPGQLDLVPHQHIKFSELEGLLLDVSDNGPKTKYISPIRSNIIRKKINNADEILADEQQLTKFLGEFVWNYFRQIIRENKILVHNKKKHKITGPADYIIFQSLLSDLKEHKIEYAYDPDFDTPDHYQVSCLPYLFPPEYGHRIIQLRQMATQHGVEILFKSSEVLITKNYCAPQISAEVNDIPEVIMVSPTETDGNVIDITESAPDHHRSEYDLEFEDLLKAIRQGLHDDYAKHVLDIITNKGTVATNFFKQYPSQEGLNKVSRVNITEFLAGQKSQTDNAFKTIGILLKANSVVAAS